MDSYSVPTITQQTKERKVVLFVFGLIISMVVSIFFGVNINGSEILRPFFPNTYSFLENAILPAMGGIIFPIILYFISRHRYKYFGYGALTAIIITFGFFAILLFLISHAGISVL